ncbi:MAG: GtrA family protein [Desulfarculaceae bacterium]|nr:GtrA family protein [Desulfarculaceae bacterium]MCF8071978.1 GtrA family protein [Desulfarculaceae bacterium]MCF8101495.1 GtrA family protein [Desulfarculaceae bacterium]MCF8115045.1 GtrA family protein [Desulfarculaceae bacterium]
MSSSDKINLSIKYALFAAISIAANLFAQYLTAFVVPEAWSLYVCLMVGTLIGLMVKYWLDKNYIFYYQTKHLKHETGRFALYSIMGAFTTVIFWGSEISFDLFIGSDYARYIGGFFGLAVGYAVKYQLDKRFVFVKASVAAGR